MDQKPLLQHLFCCGKGFFAERQIRSFYAFLRKPEFHKGK
jgi:hypothetical protein